MAFSRMVDMKRTPADKAEDAATCAPTPMAGPDYPWGLCISLDQDDLDKLDLSDDCQAGDTIDLRAFAKVTSISRREVEGKVETRIELQITDLSVENEDTEEAEAAPAPRAKRSSRY